jgi:hypothetical protein
VDADRVLSDLQRGESLNDLSVVFWKTPEDLRGRLIELLQTEFNLTGPEDTTGFNALFGLDQRGWLPMDEPDSVEAFQILSPIRMHPHGVHDLNRWLQTLFRGNELREARRHFHGAQSLGDEEIVMHDKVIQVRNQWRDGYDRKTSKADKQWLANGEIGLVGYGKDGWLNVLFSGRPKWTFGYRGRDFPSSGGPLELAYALTVHKAQGSDFGTVFVVLPQQAATVSRELLYTALTRSKRRMVLLIEGDDAGILYDLSRPDRSETVRWNTNVFIAAVRATKDTVPYADHLIHKTLNGELVRSKSELVIANVLKAAGVGYRYERPTCWNQAQGPHASGFHLHRRGR